jgi:uncharacterized damage-inducible protein DinB
LFVYDAWANREVINTLKASASAPAPAVRLLNHIFSAQKLWIERLTRQPQSQPVWPDASLAQCEELAVQMPQAWEHYFASHDETQLAGICSYTNSKGEHYESSVGDILMHVVFHSTYHRGQIASRMRDAGLSPAYTDFIQGARSGHY